MAAKTVKMCDISLEMAAKIFRMCNYGKVQIEQTRFNEILIVTDTNPEDLIYPEGWYCNGAGEFSNKETSTTGMHQSAPMKNSKGERWIGYYTLDD